MKRLLPLVLFLIVLSAQAQTKLSDKADDFVGDVKALLLAGQVADAEKLSADLEELWNSGKLTEQQKQQVIKVSQLLYRKRMRTNPHFAQFYTMLVAGTNNKGFSGKRLENMLEVTEKAIQKEDTKRLEQFLNTASLYLSTSRLFQNSYYSLRVSEESFSFAYEGASKADGEGKESDGWEGVSWDDEVDQSAEEVDDVWGTVITAPKKEDKKKAAQQRKESLKKQFIAAQPEVSGPVLKLEDATLTFVTPWDSTSIAQTSGQLMLVNNMFVGEGGKFGWEVQGKPASADLQKYSFNVSFAGFKAPDVTLSYPSVLAAPVDGNLQWISSKRKTGNYPYPKFSSFTSDAKVTSLGDNIFYKGGFSLVGDIIGSQSLDGSLSEVVVSHKGVRKFRSMARNYTFEDTLLLASRAAIAIYQQQDSLTHPAMQLRFSRGTQELTLNKDKGSYSHTPFFDSYHKLEITAERLHWNLNKPQVDFSILNTKTLIPVQLESQEYYSNNRYQQLVGVASFHPLQVLVGYGIKAKSNEFYASEVARATKVSEAAIKEAAAGMSYQRFINYDPASGYIELKPKAWHYVGASRDLKDYDHLVIKSVVPSGKNATLNLDNNKFTIRGVSKITFNNDTASVYILPRRQEIHVLKNRDIEFDGQVFASQLAFKGTDFKFNYDEFSIDLAKLDTIALVSRKRRNREGESSDQVLTGKGSSRSGKLYINKPNNKSGEKLFAEYPKFNAPEGAVVAFNRPDVAGGAYDSTVYFDMPPFKLDSLSSGKGVVSFDGTFNSGGIFPPIKTKLQMMPDETLGFYYQPGAKGLAAYGGKGVAYDTIMMSSGGIQSKGKLEYLTATLEAPVYTYFKNGVVAKGGTLASIKEGNGEYPIASLTNFNMNWQPQADTMYLQTTEDPMKIYKEEYAFKGTVQYTPGGLYGSGELDNPVAKITAPEMNFKLGRFSGNHAGMVVKSGVEGKPAVEALDVAFDYDLTKGLVDFESEQKGVANMEFPKAQYKTSMSSARWDMKKQNISLKADENGGNNWFYSMHPQQGGLQFMAGSGDYNLKDNTIRAGGVPYIAVADVHIVPDSGKVAVAADATIQTLRNARVLADSAEQFHKLYKGNIDILSRMAFKGDALHDYLNAAADSFQLQFTGFTYGNPDRKKRPVYTYATADIKEESSFYIFPRILYQGKITMHALQKHMDFDGALKLNFTDNPADSDWFPYKKDTLDPENVRIPIIKPKAADGTPLHTGLHMSAGAGKLYSTFVSKKQAKDDLDLFSVDGLLSYDKQSSEFKIGREARAYADSYEGNVMLYNEASNTIHFEGKLNLLKPTRNFSIEGSGSGDINLDSSRYNLNAFLAFDMDVPKKALEAMAGNLRGNGFGAVAALGDQESMRYKLAQFIGDKEMHRHIERSAVAYVPLPKISKTFVRSLILDQVNLQWSNEQNAWYSVGSISLASILKDDINARMDGYLELRQDMNGDPTVNLYLQADPYTWYYFSLFENGMTMASSDDSFNKVVSSKAKGSRGSSYGVYTGEAIEKNQFLEYFSKTYLSGERGFKVASGQPAIEPAESFGDQEDDAKQDKRKKKKKGKEDPFGVEPEID